MKAFLGAMVALAIIAVGMNVILENAGFSAAQEFSGSNVRLGD